MNNFLPLNRKIQAHWIWLDKPFSKGQAWIDLLLLANYEDKKIPYKGEMVICKRGDVNMSISSLADRWGWSRRKATDFLSVLVQDEMVAINATKHRTTITIVNYEDFNNSCATKEQQDEQQTNNQQATNEQQADITKKDKKDKKGNNIIPPLSPTGESEEKKRFYPPDVEEVRAYCAERGNPIDAETFVDYYTSNGWMVGKSKMKDWKAAIRTWERKRGFKNEKKPPEKPLDRNAGLQKRINPPEDCEDTESEEYLAYLADDDAHRPEDGWAINDDGYWVNLNGTI